MLILVRCSSHRARQRLFCHLGREPQGYFSIMEKSSHYGQYEVTPEELAAARNVKGITKVQTKDLDKWYPCWDA